MWIRKEKILKVCVKSDKMYIKENINDNKIISVVSMLGMYHIRVQSTGIVYLSPEL